MKDNSDIPSMNIDQKPACITTSFRFPSVTRKFWRQNYMGVSKTRGGPPKSSILMGFSIINHQFWGFSPYFWKHPYKHLQLFGRKCCERPGPDTEPAYLISCRKINQPWPRTILATSCSFSVKDKWKGSRSNGMRMMK